MNDDERKRLRRLGRDEVERQSRELHERLDAENTAPIGSDEWIANEIAIRRREAAERRARGTAWAPRVETPAETLPDRAFQLARRGGESFPGPAEARKQLATEFPDVSSDPYAAEFFDVYDRALALLAEASVVADAVRDGRMTEEEAKHLLAKRCDGFTAETYNAAFGEGLFRTR